MEAVSPVLKQILVARVYLVLEPMFLQGFGVRSTAATLALSWGEVQVSV